MKNFYNLLTNEGIDAEYVYDVKGSIVLVGDNVVEPFNSWLSNEDMYLVNDEQVLSSSQIINILKEDNNESGYVEFY